MERDEELSNEVSTDHGSDSCAAEPVGYKEEPKVKSHVVTMKDGTIEHDIVELDGFRISTYPHHNNIPCDRCLALGDDVPIVRIIREGLSNGQSMAASKAWIRALITEERMVQGLEDILGRVAFADDVLTYTRTNF